MKKHLIASVLLLASLIHGGLHAQTKRIAVAYSAISATQSGFYLAKDANIFDKHGLYVDPVYVAGGSRVAQAIIAGESIVKNLRSLELLFYSFAQRRSLKMTTSSD